MKCKEKTLIILIEQIIYLSGTTIDLLLDLVEFASNVSSVAIQDWRVSVADLSGVVEDNDLKKQEIILDSAI